VFRELQKFLSLWVDVKEQASCKCIIIRKIYFSRRSAWLAEARGSREVSYKKGFFEIKGFAYAMVFGFCDGFCIEKIEPERVGFKLCFFEKSSTQGHPFFSAQLTFKDGFLDADSIIRASSGDSAQAAGSSVVGGGNIIGNENKHIISAG